MTMKRIKEAKTFVTESHLRKIVDDVNMAFSQASAQATQIVRSAAVTAGTLAQFGLAVSVALEMIEEKTGVAFDSEEFGDRCKAQRTAFLQGKKASLVERLCARVVATAEAAAKEGASNDQAEEEG